MPHNDTGLIQADLSPADIFSATVFANRARLEANHLASRIARNAARLATLPSDEMSADAQELTELLHEVAAQHAAVLAMFETAIHQRDAALRGQAGWYDDILRRLADAQGCSKAEAAKLMIALLNPDHQLMADDVVAASDTLDQVRWQIKQVIDWLNEDLLVEVE